MSKDTDINDAIVGKDLSKLASMHASGLNFNDVLDLGVRPLALAASLGQKEVVKALIAYGADVNGRDLRTGQTALHLACQDGRGELVGILLAAGADSNASDNNTQTPLSISLTLHEKKYVNVISKLLKHGANANEEGYVSPLMLASAHSVTQAVLELLNGGAAINVVRPGGTALTHAISYRNSENARLLVSRGADPHLCVPHNCPETKIAGKSAFEMAELVEDPALLAELRSKFPN